MKDEFILDSYLEDILLNLWSSSFEAFDKCAFMIQQNTKNKLLLEVN